MDSAVVKCDLNTKYSLNGDEICSNTLLSARDRVKALYDFRDQYFVHNGLDKAGLKEEKVREELKQTMDFMQALENDKTISKSELLLLRGKALNVLKEFSQAAFDNLSKAVKLNPKSVESWVQLGECYCKKNDYEAAKNCLTGALGHRADKVALRNLSMVLRKLSGGSAATIEESVERAKEAVQLDVSDGMSWYVLGNAYLALFFGTTQSSKIFRQCTSAYKQAEKDPVAFNLPDFCFNCGVASKYQENYKQALDSFRRARDLDPAWTEPEQLESELVTYLQRVSELTESKGMLKRKKLQQLIEELNSDSNLGPYENQPAFRLASFGDLAEPHSDAKDLVAGKVVCCVHSSDPVPFTFCVVDRMERCVAVMVYNLAPSCGPKIGDSVVLVEPTLRRVEVEHAGKGYAFNSVRVESPTMLVINGRRLEQAKHASAVLSTSLVGN